MPANINGRQHQTQLNLNEASAAPSTRGTRSAQERTPSETDSARTGDVTHDIVGLSLDKDTLSMRRQAEHETALNTAPVDGSVSSCAHQAPVPLSRELRSQGSFLDGRLTQPTGVENTAHAQTTRPKGINATPPSAIFEASPPLKAVDLRNVNAGPSLQGPAEALSVRSLLMQYHFTLLNMTQAARAFLNDATKAGNKNRGIGHVKSQSITSHVPNASADRNARKTAQSFVSMRSNPSRANVPPGLPYVNIFSVLVLAFEI